MTHEDRTIRVLKQSLKDINEKGPNFKASTKKLIAKLELKKKQ